MERFMMLGSERSPLYYILLLQQLYEHIMYVQKPGLGIVVKGRSSRQGGAVVATTSSAS